MVNCQGTILLGVCQDLVTLWRFKAAIGCRRLSDKYHVNETFIAAARQQYYETISYLTPHWSIIDQWPRD